MERATLLVCEVVPLVVCNQVDNRSLGQCCGLVEHEPAVLDTGLKRAHGPTVRVSWRAGKGSGCAPIGTADVGYVVDELEVVKAGLVEPRTLQR